MREVSSIGLQLVVWDFNGVAVADAQASFEAACRVINTYHGELPTLPAFRRTIINPFVQFYVLWGCDQQMLKDQPELMGQIFHASYEPRAVGLRTRRGVRAALRYLQRRRIPAIILSNHTPEGVEAQLKRLELKHFFAAVLTNQSGQTAMVKRNKLERLRDFLAASGYAPARCLIVGDSPEEIEIGRELGLKTVAVAGGYYAAARLRVAAQGQGPHFPVISNLGHLINIFEQMEKGRVL